MKTFRDHLKDLENRRKNIINDNINSGYIDEYVHGTHAQEEDTKPLKSLMVNYKEFPSEVKESYGEDWFGWAHDYTQKDDVKGLHDDLHSHYTDKIQQHEDLDHLNIYTRASRSLNKALVENHKNNKPDLIDNENMETRKQGLDRLLSEHPSAHDFTTFSGLGYDPRKKMNENNDLFSPSYISSSIDPNVAYGFSKEINKLTGEKNDSDIVNHNIEQHILKVNVPKGSKMGAYVDGVAHFPGEGEFLHKRGQTYNIDPTPEIRTAINGSKVYVWNGTPKNIEMED